jgi:hypothetical protein
VLTIRLVTSIMAAANQHLSRTLRGLALAATTVGLVCADGSQAAQQPTRDARLSGSVEVCKDILQKCSRVSAVVTLLSVHGKSRTAVGKQYAARGRFSFLVAPGTYFPSPSAIRAPVDEGKCISGYAVVRAHHDVTDSVLCAIRRIRPASRLAQAGSAP